MTFKFIFLLTFFSQVSKAQILQDSVSVVISLTDDNQANLNNVKTKIQALSNVDYVGFCNNHKVFLLYIDPHFHGSQVVFLSNLIKATGIYGLTLKEGTVGDILKFCDFKDPAEYEKNKLKQAQ